MRVADRIIVQSTVPALAQPPVEREGPLSPCLGTPGATDNLSSGTTDQWTVAIATSFSKEAALDEFNRVKQDYPDILGGYAPIIVEQCDLSMGTSPQYSARIVTEGRAAADELCNKLQQSGGACLVQKD